MLYKLGNGLAALGFDADADQYDAAELIHAQCPMAAILFHVQPINTEGGSYDKALYRGALIAICNADGLAEYCGAADVFLSFKHEGAGKVSER